MYRSMRVNSIGLYIEEIVVAVKLLFEENVAEYLCAVQGELVPFICILRRSLLLSSYYLKEM